eukprot:TRINITY_DN101935_c0_g1_i2.p1 TRINITY_DN101935_c0_g1~~TRINITY_DN101935_c0_g1_i2.p1  ORF type:complete len:1389 (+),score=291.53 TRINITY_DN101935_c0_g1_i2:209-4168(+)
MGCSSLGQTRSGWCWAGRGYQLRHLPVRVAPVLEAAQQPPASASRPNLRRHPPLLHAAAGIGMGILARAGCSSASSSLTLRRVATNAKKAKSSSAEPVLSESVKQQMTGALKLWQTKEPVIDRYMNSALDPWPGDYLAQTPYLESDIGGSIPEAGLDDAIGLLEDRQVRGPLQEVRCAKKEIDGKWFVVVSVDVDGLGFVCGLGYAESEELGEQLAARMVLDRLVIEDAPVQAVFDAAEQVKTHKHHAGASDPCRHAGELIEALRPRLQELNVCSFCPCGKVWMSSIVTELPGQHNRVSANSADHQQSTSLALCGEVIIGRLRWALKVKADEPHKPEEWARNVDERLAAERLPNRWRPGGRGRYGRTRQAPQREALHVAPLGSQASGANDLQAILEAVLGDEDAQAARSAALEVAVLRRAAIFGKRAAESNGISQAESEAEAACMTRCYEVTDAAADPRRKEIVGQLPVEQIREELSETLKDQQVVVVSGGTGSGKSTQLPQFLLDDWRSGGKGEVVDAPRVVVTQPRRLAAISIAERVAWERSEKLGTSIGYAVRGNAVRPSRSGGSVEFVTTGTLLRRAIDDPQLVQCNCVIVDEVHERDMMADFLLILLREVLPKRPDLRIILMSATLDVDTFTRYFGGCGVLQVPSAPRFPVEELHLGDDFFAKLAHGEPLRQAEVDGRTGSNQWMMDSDEQLRTGSQRWWGSDEGDTTFLDLTEETIRAVVPEALEAQEAAGGKKGSILVFMPGWSEIRRMLERLAEGEEGKPIWALPLHSSLPKEQQQKVFEHAPKGKVKVILSTNIAETSVTINDVTVVIDTGLQRELTYDPKRQMSFLDTVWVSRSNAVQRKGRAGRVRKGKVYRLYTREQLDLLPHRPMPQIQRCDLAQSCLQALALGRDPHVFLAQAPDPPATTAVNSAMKDLTAIDAVGPMDDDGVQRILPVGEVITRLPLEPLLGRAMMLGTLLDIPEQAGTLLAISGGGRSPFATPPGRQRELLAKRREFCDWSDTFVTMQTLLMWEGIYAKSGDKAATTWASRNYLSPSRLRGFSKAKFQLLRDVRRSGLLRDDRFSGLALHLPAAATETLRALEEESEDEEEDASALFESPSDMQALHETQGDDESEDWLAFLGEQQVQAEDAAAEPLLPAVLCSAYPSNLAVRKDPESPNHVTQNFAPVRMSPSSVNALDEQNNRDNNNNRNNYNTNRGPPSWWLFSELQVSGGRGFLQSTTKLEDWHVGLFGGLQWKDMPGIGNTELDGWLTISGEDAATGDMLKILRKELREALAWQALATLRHGRGHGEGVLVKATSSRRCRLSAELGAA